MISNIQTSAFLAKMSGRPVKQVTQSSQSNHSTQSKQVTHSLHSYHSSQNYVTADTFHNLKIELDVENTRLYNKTDDMNKFPIYYVPLKTSQNKPINIKFQNQILAANARPCSTDPAADPKQVKYLNLTFRGLNDDEIDDLPYQNKHILKKANHSFIHMLDGINNAFIELYNSMKTCEHYVLPKNCKMHGFMQDKYLSADDNEYHELDSPLFRLKLPVFDGKVGSSFNGQFYPNTTDALLDKIMTNCSIDEACRTFRYGSLCSGMLSLDCLVISSQGVSLRAKISKLQIMRNPLQEPDFEDLKQFI